MKKLILLANLLLIVSTTFAQINGKVLDENREPIPGVNITIKETTQGTITDLNGSFKINATQGDVLIIKSIGFLTKELKVSNQTNLEIVLQTETIDINEVLVMGYSNKTKTEISSSVTKINADELLDITSNDVGAMLQGKISGVQVVTGSGQPGSSSEVRIRGISTIKPGNAEPLYVVDGIIGGTFDPNDVESITVLKDAGATGMYGARANKGVIVVTTKSAKKGETSFEFKTNVGYNMADHGNLIMMSGSEFHETTAELYRDPSTHLIDKIKFYQDFPKELAERDFDWVNEAFKPTYTQKYYLSASGSQEKMSYYVSSSYFNEGGTFRNTGYENLNLRANTKYKFSEKISLRNNINIALSRGNYYDYMDMYYSYLSLPWDNAYDDNGNARYVDRSTPDFWSRDNINPFHTIDNSEHEGRGFSLNYDFVLNFIITDWLSFSSSNRLSYSNDKSHDFVSPAAAGTYYDKGFVSERMNEWYGGISTNLLKFKFNSGKISFDGLAGLEFEKGKSEYMFVEGKGLPVGFNVPTVASKEKQIGGSYELGAMQSLISQFNVNYDKKYFLTASYRIDQSSNFPPEHRTAHFPSVAASWMASHEDFLKSSSAFSFLKLRASYGLTGDPDIGASRYMGLFDLNTQYNSNSAAVPLQLPNYELTWEQTNTLNIGVDLGLFKRVDLTVDLYNSVTKNLLVLVAQPLSQGFEYRWENAGQVTNNGIELGLSALIVDANDFKWDMGIVFAKNINELSGIENPIFRTVSGISQIYRNGAQIYTFMLPKWLGVDEQTGAPLWEKITKDENGVITSREPTSDYTEADPQEVGSALPDFQGGLTNTISYKGISLYFNVAFQSGNYIYNHTRQFMDHDGHEPFYNYMKPKEDWSRWEKPGDVATHPSMQNAELSRENSSRFLEDGSFIKVRSVRLSYSFPQNMITKLKLKELNVSLGADNLFTLTNFWGQDPEVTLNQGDWSMPGVTSFKYPNNKLFVFSLNIKF